MEIILLALGFFKGISLMKKEYKWYHNINIFIRSFKAWFIVEILTWITMGFVMLMYQISTLIPETMKQPIKFFGTIGNAFGIYATIFMIGLFIYGIMLLFEPDPRIEEIQLIYELEEEE